MSKLFNQVSMSKPGKSLIDLSHEKKLTMQMGDLVPILLHEVVPGDKFRVNTESLIRLAPMVAPVMHRCNAYVHYFYVPNRILFDKWEIFITGGADGKQTAQMPVFNLSGLDSTFLQKGSLADYMGIPTGPSAATITAPSAVSALPFRAYQLIYNEYYRDQNVMTPVEVNKTEGQVSESEKASLFTLRKRCWEKDYFTSALPWSQRGDEILLPNEVTYRDQGISIGTDGSPTVVPGQVATTDGTGKLSTGGVPSNIDNIEGIGITINDLRRSARLQEFLERTARGGSRLTEVIRSFFGVTSSDARLQRPEFLGGGKQPITISEVLATFNSLETAGATMYGHGLSVGNTNKFSRFFEEHGWIIGIMSVMPRTAYQQGLPRKFTKFDKFDLYWPTFAQLGEQEVHNSEVYWDWILDNPGTFGYQSRYAEYKHELSSVHGDFRDNLDFWHLGRIFDSAPALNDSFLTCDASQRIFADTDTATHKLWVQLYNDVKAIRPMPYFNNPIL